MRSPLAIEYRHYLTTTQATIDCRADLGRPRTRHSTDSRFRVQPRATGAVTCDSKSFPAGACRQGGSSSLSKSQLGYNVHRL